MKKKCILMLKTRVEGIDSLLYDINFQDLLNQREKSLGFYQKYC